MRLNGSVEREYPISNFASYPSLLSPFKLAGKTLRNRVIHSSILTLMAKNSLVTDELIQYHANRARGGVALIVTEALAMASHQLNPHRPRAWNDDGLDGLTRWAEAVETQDCRLLGQIQDPGRGRHEPGRNAEAVGASSLPDDLSWTVPHALTGDEIRRMIDGFASSSARLQRCGFSGVEISAGHGHLFHQFLSSWSNQRNDEYGGDLEGRTRFLRELISAIRSACGGEFIVGLKLPGNDWIPGGIGPTAAAQIASRVTVSDEVSYVCFTQGAHAASLERHLPDGNAPRVPYRSLIGELRRAIPNVPVAALGRITDPAEAENLIDSGDVELVAVGRTLIADPAWLSKARQGRAHDIRYCVSCNTCWDTITTRHLPVACDNNPRVGKADEVDFRPVCAQVSKRVVVVGTGIAGMEATWVAAARGHQATAFSRSGLIGGKTRLRALLPGGEACSSIYDYQHAAALRAGAQLELGVTANVADIIALRPDTVVLASGASMIPPYWLPQDVLESGLVLDLRSAIAPLVGRTQHETGTAVIFDADHMEGTYAAAELLRRLFDRVVLITPREFVAQDVSLVTRQGIVRRMHEQRIERVVLAEPCWTESIEEGKLEYANVYTGDRGFIENVAFFAYSTPRAPCDVLLAPLRAAGIDVRLVGDCRSARGVLAATSEGHAVGNAI